MSRREWGIRLIAYPVILALTLIFLGPTIPIDMFILIIATFVAMLGLSKEQHVLVLGFQSYIMGWKRKHFELMMF